MTKDGKMMVQILEKMVFVYPNRKVWKVKTLASETGLSVGKVSFAMRELEKRKLVTVVKITNGGLKYYQLGDEILDSLKNEVKESVKWETGESYSGERR